MKQATARDAATIDIAIIPPAETDRTDDSAYLMAWLARESTHYRDLLRTIACVPGGPSPRGRAILD
jgi:hypothetical protein